MVQLRGGRPMSETQSNVNLDGKVSTEINVKRLGRQQKDILRFLYENRGKVFKQTKIITELYDEVTNSRKASVSRSVTKLREKGVVFRQQTALMTPEDSPLISESFYYRTRPRFGITEDGEAFLESDPRFPNIEPEEVDQ